MNCLGQMDNQGTTANPNGKDTAIPMESVSQCVGNTSAGSTHGDDKVMSKVDGGNHVVSLDKGTTPPNSGQPSPGGNAASQVVSVKVTAIDHVTANIQSKEINNSATVSNAVITSTDVTVKSGSMSNADLSSPDAQK